MEAVDLEIYLPDLEFLMSDLLHIKVCLMYHLNSINIQIEFRADSDATTLTLCFRNR